MNARFGPFRLDAGARQLTRRGEVVNLSPKALDLLEYLIEKRPRAVAKAQIKASLWPTTFVSEATLASLVRDVRDALGDDPRSPRFVRTAHRFGYAFCGEAVVEDLAEDSREGAQYEFRLLQGEREIGLRPGENVLGRTREAAVWIEHASVSRRHALVRIIRDRAVLEDCGSKNGTFVGRMRVTSPVPLRDGDVIRLGKVRLLLRILPLERSTLTASRSGD
jgi:DNA-binding winged helix-turn-helix (wHTH) protein